MLITPTNYEPMALENLELLRISTDTTYKQKYKTKKRTFEYDDDCFYYHSWRNNVVIAFGTLSSFIIYI